jgi:hypothetical protein
MRRLVLCLLLLAAFGCEGSNELVSPPDQVVAQPGAPIVLAHEQRTATL